MSNRIILAIVIGTFIASLIWYQENYSKNEAKVFDDSIEYTTKTYRPYDTKFVYDSFKKQAKKGFKQNTKAITDSLNKNFKGSGNLMVVVSPYFLPTQTEVDSILNFVENGNDLFVSAFTISSFFMNSAIALDSTDASFEFDDNFPPEIKKGRQQFIIQKGDSTTTEGDIAYSYPGAKITNVYGFFKKENYGKANLAYDDNNEVALISTPYGDGNIYINFCPIVLTNYFMLHRQNYSLFNEIYGLIEAADRPIIWDRFYEKHKIQRPDPEYDKEPGESYFWKIVEEHPSLAWAVFTFFLGIGLFILVYSRPMQKPVAVIAEPENNSLAFVKAVAGLYWLKQDHKKIAEKISQHFYDYLATNYRLVHKEIIIDNLEKIATKTGRDQKEIIEILTTIEKVENSEKIDKKTLMSFYAKVHGFVNQ